VRWQKAIVNNRLFTYKEQNEVHFVLRWKHQLGLDNQQHVQNRKEEHLV